MRPLVFLDIDGVLNTSEHYARWHTAMTQRYGAEAPPSSIPAYGEPDVVGLLFGESHVAQLNWITERTGAAVVVSSSWRLFFAGPPPRPVFSDLVRILRRAGVSADVIGATPPSEPDRGRAIRRWLEREGVWAAPVPLAILDDFPEGQFPSELRHVLVQTDPDSGLVAADAERAERLLKKSAF